MSDFANLFDDLNNDQRLSESVAERWGDAAAAGFIAVPNMLVRAQAKLKLTPTELVVLLNILLHWWHSARMPYPSTPAIAKRSGISVRTVQRSVRALEKKGLISRVRTPSRFIDGRNEQTRAKYDLTGLRNQLSELARSDVWYRPEVVRRAPAGAERRTRGGIQTRA